MQNRFLVSVLAGTASVGSSVALAQSEPAAPAAGEQIEEVVVTGFRSSLEQALEKKRAATNFVDSISAEDVGKLPDNNVAEAIARIPGVQISRTNGEGQQVSMRGLGASFVSVTLDGMPISVASEGSVDQAARNREFDFDFLPSELFTSLEVIKSPSASTVEGGLAGTLNLRVARPFDQDGFVMSYKLEGQYQNSSEEVDPRASLLISQNWGDKFGVLINIAAAKRTYRTDGWSSQGWAAGLVPSNAAPTGFDTGFNWNLPSVTAGNPASLAPGFVNESGLTNQRLAAAELPRLLRPEVQVGNRDRIGGTMSFQFRPVENFGLNLDLMYAKLDAEFDRYTNNLLVRNTNSGQAGPLGFGFITPRNFVVDDNNTLMSGRLENARFWSENRLFIMSPEFKSYALSGDWEITDNVRLDFKAHHSESELDFRQTTYLFLTRSQNVTLENNGGMFTVNSDIDLANASNWAFNTVRVQPRVRNEENETAKLDLTIGDEDRNIRIGAMYNTFYRERNEKSASIAAGNAIVGAQLNQFGYTGPATIEGLNLTGLVRPVPVDYGKDFDFDPGYRSWITADLRAWDAYLDPDAMDAQANLARANSGFFEEENLSAYFEFNKKSEVLGKNMRINAGLRVVSTDQDLTGYVQVNPNIPPPAAQAQFGYGPEAYATNTTKGHFAAWLPSLNVAYDFSDNVVGRVGLTRSLTRPSPQQTMPFTSINTSGVVSQGNPDLSPYLANQIDLGVEWYFSEGAVLAASYFRKDISGFAVQASTRQPFRNMGVQFETLDPVFQGAIQGFQGTQGNADVYDTLLTFNTFVNNPNKSYVKGLELLYQQRLDMILGGLGFTFNYTKIDGKSGPLPTANPPIAQPIVGLAENNFNAVAYLERERFALRLSYNYRDDYVEGNPRGATATGSPLTQFRRAAGYLDFNSSVNFDVFGQKLVASLEVLNVLEEEEFSFYTYESGGDFYENRGAVFNSPGRVIMMGLRGTF
jgi:iron complex outermembrane receptor protein